VFVYIFVLPVLFPFPSLSPKRGQCGSAAPSSARISSLFPPLRGEISAVQPHPLRGGFLAQLFPLPPPPRRGRCGPAAPSSGRLPSLPLPYHLGREQRGSSGALLREILPIHTPHTRTHIYPCTPDRKQPIKYERSVILYPVDSSNNTAEEPIVID